MKMQIAKTVGQCPSCMQGIGGNLIIQVDETAGVVSSDQAGTLNGSDTIVLPISTVQGFKLNPHNCSDEE